MKITLSSEKWNQHHQPTAGGSWCFVKKGKKTWFLITEQGWTKDGVYLILKKKK